MLVGILNTSINARRWAVMRTPLRRVLPQLSSLDRRSSHSGSTFANRSQLEKKTQGHFEWFLRLIRNKKPCSWRYATSSVHITKVTG